jgi:uncharacterized protein YecE (DUF72 family)
MVRTGCAGFPVARARYFSELPAVEISDTFQKLPKLSTVANWRAEAPKDFAFAVRAWQAVTHTTASASYEAITKTIPLKRRDAYGHFRRTPEVDLAWDSTRAVATALEARFVLFETPSSFYPDANHLRDMYAFFKSIRRDKLTLAWQPKGAWDMALVRRVCKDLDLVHAFDPLARADKLPRADVNYFRVHALPAGDGALRALKSLCEGASSYVFFTARNGWFDARRFQKIAEGR